MIAASQWRRLAIRWLAVCLCMAAACGVVYAARERVLPMVAQWLDVGEAPRASSYVMVLPGDSNVRPFVAAALIAKGKAQRALIPMAQIGPEAQDGIAPPDHEILRKVLLLRGVPVDRIEVLHGSSNSTFDDAQALAVLLERSPGATVAIVTSHFHTRRARWVFRQVLGRRADRIHFVSAPTDYFDADDWWRTRQGLLAYSNEYLKFCFYLLRYSLRAQLAVAAVVLLSVYRYASRRLRRPLQQAPEGRVAHSV